MKLSFPIILAIVAASNLLAVTATKELDADLLSIFEQMQAGPDVAKLEGREFVADLTVKVATEKFLIFTDAYLQADEETKYQIGKWIFTPDQVSKVAAKRGDILAVKFKIEEIRTEAPYADMPHFIATIISMSSSEKEADQDGGINSEEMESEFLERLEAFVEKGDFSKEELNMIWIHADE